MALYKGATPPAVGWAAIDSVLLGALHNYRLLLARHGMTETVPGTDVRRLTLLGHGIAGLGAGLTRYYDLNPVDPYRANEHQCAPCNTCRTFEEYVAHADCCH